MKIAIIGGGPIGLYAAHRLTELKVEYTLFEATSELGGQINLYPHKKFLDVNNFIDQEAISFIDYHLKNIDLINVKLNAKVIDIKEENNNVILTISDGSKLTFTHAIITTGLGSYTPRPLGLEGENKCKNILYTLNDFSFLENKKVAIFGGGDSALDWAREISFHSNDVHLIHRRTEFRGNADTIKGLTNLSVHLPYVPYELIMENDTCKTVRIKNVNSDEIINISVDYILVNYGSIPTITPFNLPRENNFLKVGEHFQLDAHIYACGDCVFYEKKLRRIEPGIKEVESVFHYLNFC